MPACLPSRQWWGMRKDFFISLQNVLLQNVASGMGCLLKPVFYKQIKSINPMVFVIFTKISAFCAVCVHNGYLHFTRRQSNLSTVRNLGDLQWKLVPGAENYTYS